MNNADDMERSIKIVEVFPGRVWGGAEQYVLDLGRELQRRGCEVCFACLDARPVTSRLDADSIPYVRADAEGLARVAADADVIHIHDKRFISTALKVRRLTGGKQRVVMTRHIARASRVWWPFRRRYLGLDAIVFVSELGRDLWCGVNGWMPREKCHVVLNSVSPLPDDGGRCPENLRSRFGLGAEVPLLLFTGRVRRSKGCETIIRALGTLRGERFAMVFVGACKPKDYDKKLLKLASEYGIADRVFFTGFMAGASRLIPQADLGVQPSIVREAGSLTVIEFMQAGKCVIASNNGSQPEFIESGRTGLLVAPDNAGQLAAAIREMIEKPAWRDEIGARAAEHFRRELSYAAFVDKLFAVLKG